MTSKSARKTFRLRGFTLVEVMVALAIVAIVLMAGTRATGLLIESTSHLEKNFLGTLCLQNTLSQVILNGGGVQVGTQNSTCTLAGKEIDAKLTVHGTVSSKAKLVEAQALQNGSPIASLMTLLVAS